jgi:hypothetical protein
MEGASFMALKASHSFRVGSGGTAALEPSISTGIFTFLPMEINRARTASGSDRTLKCGWLLFQRLSKSFFPV